MLKGINVKQRFEYSAPNDKENPTVFVLKPLTSFERFNLSQNLENGVLKLNGKSALETFLVVVDEIKNIDIGEDHFDLLKSDKEKELAFNSLANELEIISGIFTKAMSLSTLSKEETKNL